MEIEDYARAQILLKQEPETWTKKEAKFMHRVVITLASLLPSPSLINAHSALMANPPEKLYKFVKSRQPTW